MNIPLILAEFDRYERREALFPDIERHDAFPVVRSIAPPGDRSFIIYSLLDGLSDGEIDRVIDRETAFFAEIDRELEWKVYSHDFPSDLAQRLVAQGFEEEEAETVLVLELAHAAPVLLRPVTADVRRVDPRGDIEGAVRDILAIEEAVWDTEMGWLGERLARQLRLFPDYCSVYIAYDAGRPVSCAWINFPSGSPFASLWGGSTLSEFRGRGYYTALLSARAQEAIRRGAAYLTIDASEMSQPIVQKYGFMQVSVTTPCVKHL